MVRMIYICVVCGFSCDLPVMLSHLRWHERMSGKPIMVKSVRITAHELTFQAPLEPYMEQTLAIMEAEKNA